MPLVIKGPSHAPNRSVRTIDGCSWRAGSRSVAPAPGKEQLWSCLLGAEHCQSDGSSPPMAIFGTDSTISQCSLHVAATWRAATAHWWHIFRGGMHPLVEQLPTALCSGTSLGVKQLQIWPRFSARRWSAARQAAIDGTPGKMPAQTAGHIGYADGTGRGLGRLWPPRTRLALFCRDMRSPGRVWQCIGMMQRQPFFAMFSCHFT